MGRWTVYGLLGVGAMHHFWPLFRRQTWAIKAFLVTSCKLEALVRELTDQQVSSGCVSVPVSSVFHVFTGVKAANSSSGLRTGPTEPPG